MDRILNTPRLTLRPFDQTDAKPVQKLAGTWSVASMLARVPYPYENGMAEAWIDRHEEMRETGEEFCYAITKCGHLIGSAGVMKSEGDDYEIGYWIGLPFWGKGYASEAARAVKSAATDALKLRRMVSGHFADNPASGRVLTKLGFVHTHDAPWPCVARGQEVLAKRMVWTA